VNPVCAAEELRAATVAELIGAISIDVSYSLPASPKRNALIDLADTSTQNDVVKTTGRSK